MLSVDSRLKAAVERGKAAREKLNPSPKKIGQIQQKAKEAMYATPESAAAANAVLATERKAKAFMVIDKLQADLGKGTPVKGALAFTALQNEVNLFPADAGMDERKEIYMSAALDQVDTGADEEYHKRVVHLWGLMEPAAREFVEHVAVSHEHLADAFEKELNRG